MPRKILLHAIGISILTLGCQDRPTPPVFPSVLEAAGAAVEGDSGKLKADPPSVQSPTGGGVTANLQPALEISSATAWFASVPFSYEFIVLRDGQLAHASGLTPHTVYEVPAEVLEFDAVYTWQARAAWAGAYTEWSGEGIFRTPARPLIPAARGILQVPHLDPSNMFDFILQFAPGHPEWEACAAGSGTACFRFVWSVAEAANPTCDPNSWGLLSKNPGEWQCTPHGCGHGAGGFGEDILTYGGTSPMGMYDIVGGAGAPGATLSWQDISFTRRAGNDWACPWR